MIFSWFFLLSLWTGSLIALLFPPLFYARGGGPPFFFVRFLRLFLSWAEGWDGPFFRDDAIFPSSLRDVSLSFLCTLLRIRPRLQALLYGYTSSFFRYVVDNQFPPFPFHRRVTPPPCLFPKGEDSVFLPFSCFFMGFWKR